MDATIDQTPAVQLNNKYVLFSYGKWLLGAAVIGLFAFGTAALANALAPWSMLAIQFLQLAGEVIAAGGLGKLGYEIQTWGGESPHERLNDRLFLVFSILGFFIIVFSQNLVYTDVAQPALDFSVPMPPPPQVSLPSFQYTLR